MNRLVCLREELTRCFALSTIALCLAACDSQSSRALEQTIEQSHKIAPNGTLSIRNVDGSIRIYGSDGDELKLQAIKKAYTAERLNKISVDVSVQPGLVSIETKYPPKPKWFFFDRSGTVDYVILLPQWCSISRLELATGEVLVEGMRGENIHANLVNGRLMGRNCFGDIRLAVVTGALDVVYDWWEKRRFAVDAQIVNGNARAFIPDYASLRLVAAAANGNVANELGEKQDRPRGAAKKVDTTIGGSSETDLKIQAINGSIKIVEVR